MNFETLPPEVNWAYFFMPLLEPGLLSATKVRHNEVILTYTLKTWGPLSECNCPGYVHKHVRCKHIKMFYEELNGDTFENPNCTHILNSLFSQVIPGWYKMPVAPLETGRRIIVEGKFDFHSCCISLDCRKWKEEKCSQNCIIYFKNNI